MPDNRGSISLPEKPLEIDGANSSAPLLDVDNPFQKAAEGLKGHPGWSDYLAAREAMREREETEILERTESK